MGRWDYPQLRMPPLIQASIERRIQKHRSGEARQQHRSSQKHARRVLILFATWRSAILADTSAVPSATPSAWLPCRVPLRIQAVRIPLRPKNLQLATASCVICPRCDVTMLEQIDSPRPRPLSLVVKNESKHRSRSSGDKPGPLIRPSGLARRSLHVGESFQMLSPDDVDNQLARDLVRCPAEHRGTSFAGV